MEAVHNMNHLSLFTGYEGFGLGLKMAGMPIRTVLYCENEPYAQEILRARIRDGFLDDAPIWFNICDLDGSLFAGKVDIITAGFPCQPHSVAGNRQGESDERNLWPQTRRIIDEIRPSMLMLENVPGISVRADDGRPAYGGVVLGELSELGYDCVWTTVSASDSGAPHLRKRWWVTAHSNSISI